MNPEKKDLKLREKRYYSEEPVSSIRKNKIEKLPHIGKRSYDSAENSVDKEKYLGLLSGIDKLCDSYEHIPTVEVENKEKGHFTSRHYKDPEIAPAENAKINYIITMLKQRLKNYPKLKPVCPFTSRFKVVSGTEEKVGPGTYSSTIEKKKESYEFSNIPRLFTPITHMMHTIESLYKRKSSIFEEAIIVKNKNQAGNFSKLKEDLANKVSLKKDKEKNVRLKKEQIEKDKKIEIVNKLSEKNKKYEMRLYREEANAVCKSWVSILVCVGLRTVIAAKAQMRKISRLRYGKILKKFCIIVRAVGKFALALNKYRRKNVLKNIFLLQQPFTDFLEKNIERKRIIVDYFLEKSKEFPFIVHLMARWKMVGMAKKSVTSLDKTPARRSTQRLTKNSNIDQRKLEARKKLTQKII